jgi:hypothetical protein
MATAERTTVPAGHPALLWEPLPGRRARCGVCLRRCEISDGRKGWCGTRVNRGGRVFSLIYGKVASLAVSPIEKKPLFHYYPAAAGSLSGRLAATSAAPAARTGTSPTLSSAPATAHPGP